MTISGWSRLWIVAAALLATPTAHTQNPSDEKEREAALKQFLLNDAEIVGFEATASGVQVLYRVRLGFEVELVLCSWKTQPKPAVATGCVALPKQ